MTTEEFKRLPLLVSRGEVQAYKAPTQTYWKNGKRVQAKRSQLRYAKLSAAKLVSFGT